MRSYLLAPVCFIEWKILCSSKTHAVRDQEFIPSAFADNFKTEPRPSCVGERFPLEYFMRHGNEISHSLRRPRQNGGLTGTRPE
jgi:hypothetical protein